MTSKPAMPARPLTAANGCQVFKLDRISGGTEVRSRLAALGFVPGVEVELMNSRMAGSVVVGLKESRLVLGFGMAQHVWVW